MLSKTCCELGMWSELRVPFELKECKNCKMLFKSCVGYYGSGKRGCLRGFMMAQRTQTAASCATVKLGGRIDG
ncbi:hypothetical protein QQF64_026245 [Cirrhinus molitorella]|uniref:CxC7-like cysteine cluster associated with KDZ transposases domain-containing protein n=1 Tax=Cirrhinus molitorella TaxID=172907 RepID=A0ABR3NRA8_9TELE